MKVTIKYHVFANNSDEWFDTLKEAEALFKEWAQDGGNARLYKEIYEGDFENMDEPTEELCLESAGEYPL